ncbi:hypothetical protein EMIHUDRAFT_253712 [Emiliania huxleyi CCMP1516]|uniref:START domain-containing protein n=2 Tax=Emiliania huxleyi TaxID=2903 RepID=A0A0D3K3W3_EMIH1|nr:hypothetical protein EMIHUDRAFT_253712 [Emiliania huxleyi CCMP1516]EOD30448.1 hypothetical protein EMIHUDRAFT_253712 [Emiliania huxleyi CCMP1516]|eukprot:XP_005782877.1 hypothetical protein EMIHUDRAFT_253712 [Emiliania huxleyi CCMP1516]
MPELRSEVACQPRYVNNARIQGNVDKGWSVNVTMRGVIGAFSPADFEREGSAAILGTPVPDRVSICANKVREGQASLIMWERTELASWLYDHRYPERCRDWEFSPGVQFDSKKTQYFLAVNKSVGWPLFSSIQHYILWLRSQAPANVLQTIAERELKRGSACPAPETRSTPTLTFKSQEGVFVTFGTCVGLAVLISLYEAYKLQKRKQATAKEGLAATKIQRVARGKAGRNYSNEKASTDRARVDRADSKSRGVMTDTELLRELLRDFDGFRATLDDFGTVKRGLTRIEDMIASIAAPSLAANSIADRSQRSRATAPALEGTEVSSSATTRFRVYNASRPGARDMPRLALRRNSHGAGED